MRALHLTAEICTPLCLLILHLKTSKGVNGKLCSRKSPIHTLCFAAQVHRQICCNRNGFERWHCSYTLLVLALP
jgi:hypothetical protein